MKWGLSILALCALLAATAPEGGAAEQGGGDAKLLKMVVLSRHGVRSPTQSSETLRAGAARTGPMAREARRADPRGPSWSPRCGNRRRRFYARPVYCPQKVARRPGR
ncbi:MAG: hypothetical protein ACLR7Z_14935 [Bilophila wadsworthia]